ncbi:VOC family protein [Candidatus Nitrosocosmicus sp. T]
MDVTPVIDRVYYNLIYFQDPGDVLFEIATDTPGFLVDQESAGLGNKLALPKWLEPKRIYIQKTLPSLKTPSNGNIGSEKQ